MKIPIGWFQESNFNNLRIGQQIHRAINYLAEAAEHMGKGYRVKRIRDGVCKDAAVELKLSTFTPQQRLRVIRN